MTSPWSTLEEGRRCLTRLASKMTRGALCSILAEEVNIAMKVIKETVPLLSSAQSRRRHDVHGVVGIHLWMASQVACPRRKSLNSLPASISLTTSILALAALRLKKNEFWKWLENEGRVTPRH